MPQWGIRNKGIIMNKEFIGFGLAAAFIAAGITAYKVGVNKGLADIEEMEVHIAKIIKEQKKLEKENEKLKGQRRN